ncbi:MAG: hypothetical protein U0795_22490 [Pirellulales bacterium]
MITKDDAWLAGWLALTMAMLGVLASQVYSYLKHDRTIARRRDLSDDEFAALAMHVDRATLLRLRTMFADWCQIPAGKLRMFDQPADWPDSDSSGFVRQLETAFDVRFKQEGLQKCNGTFEAVVKLVLEARNDGQ